MAGIIREIRKQIRRAARENRKPVVMTLGRVQFEMVASGYSGYLGDDLSFERAIQFPVPQGRICGVPVRLTEGNVFSIGFNDK